MPLGTMQHRGPDLTNLILLEELGRKSSRVNLFRRYLQCKPSLVERELSCTGLCHGIKSGIGLGSQSEQECRQVVNIDNLFLSFLENHKSQLCRQNFDSRGAKRWRLAQKRQRRRGHVGRSSKDDLFHSLQLIFFSWQGLSHHCYWRNFHESLWRKRSKTQKVPGILIGCGWQKEAPYHSWGRKNGLPKWSSWFHYTAGA